MAKLLVRREKSPAKLLVRRERRPVDVLVRCERREAAEPPHRPLSATSAAGRCPPPPGANTGQTPRPPRAAQGGRCPRPLRLFVRRERALRPLLACGGQGRRTPRTAHSGRGRRPVLARGGQGGWPARDRGGRGRRRARAEDDVDRPAAIAAEEEVSLLASSSSFVSALRSIFLPIAQK